MNGNHSSGPSKTLLEIVPCGVGMRTKNASVPPELERMRELGGGRNDTLQEVLTSTTSLCGSKTRLKILAVEKLNPLASPVTNCPHVISHRSKKDAAHVSCLFMRLCQSNPSV
jgi:hypothetical protein